VNVPQRDGSAGRGLPSKTRLGLFGERSPKKDRVDKFGARSKLATNLLLTFFGLQTLGIGPRSPGKTFFGAIPPPPERIFCRARGLLVERFLAKKSSWSLAPPILLDIEFHFGPYDDPKSP